MCHKVWDKIFEFFETNTFYGGERDLFLLSNESLTSSYWDRIECLMYDKEKKIITGKHKGGKDVVRPNVMAPRVKKFQIKISNFVKQYRIDGEEWTVYELRLRHDWMFEVYKWIK